MNLQEKIAEMRSSNTSLSELVGTKVLVKVMADTLGEVEIKGSFRHFQSNGNASIYLEKSYKPIGKLKDTKWVKATSNKVVIL